MSITKVKKSLLKKMTPDSSPRSPRLGRPRVSPRITTRTILPELWRKVPPSHSCEVNFRSSKLNPSGEKRVMVQIRSDVLVCYDAANKESQEPSFGPATLKNCVIKLTATGNSKNIHVEIHDVEEEDSRLFIFSDSEVATKFANACSKISNHVVLEDFEPIATLGRGKWGKVTVCQKFTDDGKRKLYAVKEVEIRNKRTVKHAQEERLVMASLKQHSFVVELYFCLKKGAHLYFILEFMPGGDLYTALRRFRISAENTIFFASEILLALEHVHSHNIIHRDLKPENVLIDQEGHVKLADFGLAKRLMPGEEGTETLCGTEVYTAPEMLSRQVYSYSVDLWQFGCFVYELFVGHSPFYSPNSTRDEIRSSIMECKFRFPSSFTVDAKDLVENVLVPDPGVRFGNGANKWHDVKSHGYFAGLDWEFVTARKLTPPIRNVDSGSDVLENFEEEFLFENASFCGDDDYETPCENELVGFFYHCGL